MCVCVCRYIAASDVPLLVTCSSWIACLFGCRQYSSQYIASPRTKKRNNICYFRVQLIPLNVYHLPDVERTDAEMCTKPSWWSFKFDRLMTCNLFFPCQVFSYLVQVVLRRVTISLADISCLISSAFPCSFHFNLRENKKHIYLFKREVERLSGHTDVWWHDVEREKIWKN